MNGQTARDQALASVSDKNPIFKERALARLSEMRKGHLRCQHAGRKFTWEEILPDVEYLVGFKIPHENLNGAVCKAAISLGYIEETGVWRQTMAEEKHARRSPEYRFRQPLQ